MKHKQMEHIKTKLLIILLTIALTACGSDVQVPEIEPVLDAENLISHESQQQGIQLSYPKNWHLYDGDIIIDISPSEDLILWPNISVFTLKASPKALVSGRSATAFAKGQVRIALSNYEYGPTTIIQPVTTVTVSGRDGAIYKTEKAGIVHYSIAIKIARNRIALVSGSAKPDDISEVENIVKTIAHSVQVLGE